MRSIATRRRDCRLLGAHLAFSILLLCLAAGAAAPAVASGDAGPAAARTSAAGLLGRLQASGREDLSTVAGLSRATIEEGILVRSYADLSPLYYLCAIVEPASGVLGVVGIDAESAEWCWYSFGFRGAAFPRVGPAEAVAKAARYASARGMRGDWQAPIAVAFPDKRVCWLVRGIGDSSDRLAVDLDDPDAPVLSSRDGSLDSHLRAARNEAPSGPPPGWRPHPREPSRVHPPVFNIPDVPFHFQVTDWFCGPAATHMMLDFYGEEVGQKDISDVEDAAPEYGTFTGDNRRACHFSGMSAAVLNPELRGYRERKLGYAGNEAWLYDDPYNKLKDLIYEGMPIQILTCYDKSCTNGHYRVVKGYDDGLAEFIVHDPWYAVPFYGPDVHFSQVYLVGIWTRWSSCWALMSGPWRLTATVPERVSPGQEFEAAIDIVYPGPDDFAGQYPAQPASARITLPAGMSLASGTAEVSLPILYSGDSTRVVWSVVAGPDSGRSEIGFRASGVMIGSSRAYPSYSDSIGGWALAGVMVGDSSATHWGADERMTFDPGQSNTAMTNGRSMLVHPNGTVDAVWADSREGNSEIYYRRFENGAWDPEVRLTTDPGFSDNPVIAGTGTGDLHVVWTDYRAGLQHVYYMKWDGVTWSAETQLCSYNLPDIHPSVAVDRSGNVYVVWQYVRSGAPRIFFKKWNGTAWGQPVEIGGMTGRGAFDPSIAIEPVSEKVHIFYALEGLSRGPGDIWWRTYDHGAWSPSIAISSDSSYSRYPSATVGPGGRIHVAWADGLGGDGGDILVRTYDGTEWGPEERAVDRAGDSEYPSIAVDPSGTLHLAWQEIRNGNPEIYYESRVGSTWSGEERLTTAPGTSTLPCIGFDGQGRGYLLWTDGRDGNTEIYFKRRAANGADAPDIGRDGAVRMIRRAYPSPARDGATVEFVLGSRSPVILQLVDAGGRLVRTLPRTGFDPGIHAAHWDGRDDRGRAVPSGVYFWRLDAAGRVESRPVVIAR